MKNLFALLTVFLFLNIGCTDVVINESESNENSKDFEELNNLIKIYYPFTEFKLIDLDQLYLKYKSPVEQSRGDEIYPILHSFLSEFKDGHNKIVTKNGLEISTYEWPRKIDRKSFDPLVIRNYFETELKLAGDGRIAYGVLSNQIGYFHLPSFSGGNWQKDIKNVFQVLSSTKGLIIDVRNNTGGLIHAVINLISFITDKRIEFSFIFFDDQIENFTIIPNESHNYKNPIVILVNGVSFSAAETFPELSRQLLNVTIIGDTTGGGGGATNIFELPSGKKVQFPHGYFTRLDGSMVEWNGVIPDIVVEQTEADIKNNKDKQFEYAVNYLQNL